MKRTFTFTLFLLLFVTFSFAQKVAIVGVDFSGTGSGGDAVAFVALETLPIGTQIYITTENYESFGGGDGGFCDANGVTMGTCTPGEDQLLWTATAVIPAGNVIAITEDATADNFTVTCSAGMNCGSVTVLDGGFNIGSNDEGIYLYEDTDTDRSNGITELFSTAHHDTGGGGPIPASDNPTTDFSNSLLLEARDNFATGYEIPVADRNSGFDKAALESMPNYNTPGGTLSVVPFTYLQFGPPCPTGTCSGLVVNGSDPMTGVSATCTVTSGVNTGDACGSFIINVSGGETITFSAGNGGPCSPGGISSVIYEIDGASCTEVSTSGALIDQVINVPPGASQVTIYVCRSSGVGNVGLCNVSVVPSCTPSVTCKDIDVDIDGCAADIPAALTNPADVFDYEACSADVRLEYTSSMGDSLFCDIDQDGIDFTRTYTLYFDGVAQTPTCTQNIQVDDTTPPDITCPADDIFSCSTDINPNTNINVNTATATDNCDSNPVITFSDQNIQGVCPQEGMILRTWRATDECGNFSECVQNIDVVDNTPPLPPAPPADLNLECASDVPPPVDLTAVDNCEGDITVSPDSTLISGGCVNDFTLIRTWTFSDTCGNTSSVSQTITVLDTIAPALEPPPADLNLECADDVPPPVDLMAVDNCDGPITVSPDSTLISGGCLNDFTLIRTWTFSDTCGNTSSVSQTITVLDTISPALEPPPADLNLECADDVPPPVDLMAVDNCDGPITVSPDSTLISGGCLNDFTLIRTWTFSDTCGNTSSVSQTITVLDTISPALEPPPADLNLECADDVPPPVDLTAIDNCDGVMTVSPDSTLISGGCLNDFTLIRTWTFTDTCGNTSSVSQTITVADTIAPVIICPEEIDVCTLGDVSAPAADFVSFQALGGSASDNCGLDEASFMHVVDDQIGNTVTRTYKIADECGGQATCEQTITILGDAMPMLTAPPGLVCASPAVQTGFLSGVNPADGVIYALKVPSNGVAYTSIDWTIEGGEIISGGDGAMFVEVVWDGEAPDHSITVDVTNADGCMGTMGPVDVPVVLPLVDANPVMLMVCPQTPGSNFGVFDLRDAEDPGAASNSSGVDVDGNGVPGSDYGVSYHNTYADAKNLVNEITPIVTTSGKTVFAALPDDNTCLQVVAIWLVVNDTPPSPQTTDAGICEGVDSGASLEAVCRGNGIFDLFGFAQSLQSDQDGVRTSTFVKINSADGMALPFGSPGFGRCTNLEVDPVTGLLYSACERLDGSRQRVLTTIDPTTGAATEIGSVTGIRGNGVNAPTWDLAFTSSGDLYLMSFGDIACVTLFSVNKNTGAATLVGDPNNGTETCAPGNAFDIAPDGQAWHTNEDDPAGLGGIGTLYSLNLTTGVSTPFLPLNFIGFPAPTFGDYGLSSMDFGPDGRAYVTVFDGNTRQGINYLGILDVNTGVVTNIGQSIPGLNGIAFATEATPNPCEVSWYADQYGGTPLWTGADFDPVEIGVVNEYEEGTYMFWAQCDCICPSERSKATFTIHPEPEMEEVPYLRVCPDSDVPPIPLNSFPNDPNTVYKWKVEDLNNVIDLPHDERGELTGVNPIFTGIRSTENLGTATIRVKPVSQYGCEGDPIYIEIKVKENTGYGFVQCPGNIVTESDPGLCTADVEWALPISSSDCDLLPYGGRLQDLDPDDHPQPNTFYQIAGKKSGGDFDAKEQHKIIYQIYDNNGDPISEEDGGQCVFTIAVHDRQAPQIACPVDALILECADPTNAAQIANWLAAVTATDNCDDVEVTNNYDANAFGGFCSADGTGVQVITFAAVDESGNEAVSCVSSITIEDTTAPEVNVPGDQTVSCEASTLPSATGYATFEDECDPNTLVTYQDAITEGSCAYNYTITRTWTATDACGNASSKDQVITVEDKTAPVWLIDPADLTIECNGTDDPYGQIAAWLTTFGGGEAKDNCGQVTYSHNFTALTAGDCIGEASAVVMFSATDECNNTSNKTATVRIIDTTGPEITVPAKDQTVECDGGGNVDDLDEWLAANAGAQAADLCGPVSWLDPVLMLEIEGCGGTVEYVYMFQAKDDCDNLSNSTVASFIIEDTTPPFWPVEPMDKTVECDVAPGELEAWLQAHGEGVAQDLCSGLGGGSTTITQILYQQDFENQEDAGVNGGISCSTDNNSTFPDDCQDNLDKSDGTWSIVVNDTEPDSDLAKFELTADEDYVQVKNGMLEASDLDRSLCFESKPINIEGMTDVEFSLDISGVADGTGFESTDGYKVIYSTDGGATFTTAVAEDNDDFPAKTITINGITGESLVIRVCFYINSGGEFIRIDNVVVKGTMTQTQDLGYEYDLISTVDECGVTGTYVYQFTATDGCGNASSREATFKVIDSTPPAIDNTAKQNLTVVCDGTGNEDEIIAWLNNNAGATAEDACGAVVWSHNFAGISKACAATGGVEVTFTATDECGNASTTRATITIIDDKAPSWNIEPADLTIECGDNPDVDVYDQIDAWLATYGGADAYDDCSGAVIFSHDYTGLSDECGATGSATVTFTATDSCGNASSRTAELEVIDRTPPEITSPALNMTVECDGLGNQADLQAWRDAHGRATAKDACSADYLLQWNWREIDRIEGCGRTVEYVYEFTVKDDCDNVSAATIASFIIEDTTAPVFDTDPQPMTVECDGAGNQVQLQTWLDNYAGATASDVCSDPVNDPLTWTTDLVITQDQCGETAVYTYEFTVTDECGNATSKRATFTIEDKTPPVIEATNVADLNIQCFDGELPIEVSDWLANNAGATADDACGEATWSNDFDIVALKALCADPNNNGLLVTFTATDECGNSDDVSATINVDVVPSIGIAKRVSEGPLNNEDGTFTFTYEMNVRNTGNTTLNNVQVTDDLSATFAGVVNVEVVSIESEELTVNNDFDGYTDQNLLKGNDVLLEQEDGTIYLKLKVEPGASIDEEFCNTATASGERLNAAGDAVLTTVTDDSDNGSDPVGDNGEGGEDDCTPISFNLELGLTLNKRLSGPPVLDEVNRYVLTFELNVQNTGEADLSAVQVTDALGATFLAAEDWELLNTESEEFEINEEYNGRDLVELLTGNDVLTAGNEGSIYITVRVSPGCEEDYVNAAFVTANDPVAGTQSASDSEEVYLERFLTAVCPEDIIEGVLTQENDGGMCSAVVNFGPASYDVVAGFGAEEILLEYSLSGAGAEDHTNGEWYEGQPSGLTYLVGLTEVTIRVSIPDCPDQAASTCSFLIDVKDKEVPVTVCQDLTIPVGADCEQSITPGDIDAGSSDNCAIESREISLDGENWTAGNIDFGREDQQNSPITVYLRITDASDNQAICTAEVNLIDNTVPTITCPEDRDIYTEENLCAAKIPNLMEEATWDNCSPIDTVFQVPAAGVLWGGAHNDEVEVVLTVVDINGNTASCTVTLTLKDNVAPEFLNCPRPDIKVNTLPGMCAAFVNFDEPEAIDNCAIDRIVQTDTTGLTTGDMFPVGTTILEFTAYDVAGNTKVCVFKVIVNDKAAPEISCPESLTTGMDAGDCGKVVMGLEPSYSDNCPENTAVVYKVENGGEQIASGIRDASGTFFAEGTNTVTYRVQDQPLFLITEATHDLEATAGGSEVADFITAGRPNGDFVEVTNFGPASFDVSCLSVQRITASGVEWRALPRGVILGVGDVLTIHFGDGVDNIDAFFFNVPDAANLSDTDAAAYVIAHSGVVLDVVAVNGFDPTGAGEGVSVAASDWSGRLDMSEAGVIRSTHWDSNSAADWREAVTCDELTIGEAHLETYEDNGTRTSLQAQQPRTAACSFTITVEDRELPSCGEYGELVEFASADFEQLDEGDCYISYLEIGEEMSIADLDVYVEGTTEDFGNVTLTLVSAEGTEVVLIDQGCGTNAGWSVLFDSDAAGSIVDACGTLNDGLSLRPVNSIEAFNGEEAQGSWTLQVAHNGSLSAEVASLLNWRLDIRARLVYSQQDVTLVNDEGECGADYTWNHPILRDNCPGGSLVVIYYDEDGVEIERAEIAPPYWGSEEERYFPVGVTTVTYILRDAAGNTSECGFTVTVEDEEDPMVTCPDDMEHYLGPGECEVLLPQPIVAATDNCDIESIVFDPPFDIPFEIGVTEVTVTVTDIHGNTNTCTFEVNVIEFVPDPQVMACNDNINVTLNFDCLALITPDMILEGDNYHCYEDYAVTLTYENGEAVPTSPYVSLEDVGLRIIAEVCDTTTAGADQDDCCWGYVHVDHKVKPEFDCPEDQVVACNGSTDPDDMGRPVVTSCVLGGAIISHTDAIEDNGDCGTPRLIIRRTWRVEDALGRYSECIQTITVNSFDLEQIVWPVNYEGETALDCSLVADEAQPELSTELSPDSLGYPTLMGGTDIFSRDDYCQLSYNYFDRKLEICDGSFEILRTWVVRNICQPLAAGVNPLEYIQVIQVLDKSGPALEQPEDILISTSAFSCYGSYEIPAPVVLDACSNIKEWSVGLSSSSGALIDENGTYTAENLEIGVHTVTYRAEDNCGRKSQVSFTITVEDQIEPIAVCDDELHISVGGDGIGYITNEDVDEGSWDNCELTETWISRKLADEQIRDDYLTVVYELSFADLAASTQPDIDNSSGAEIWVNKDTDEEILRQKDGMWFTWWDKELWFNCNDVRDTVTIELLAQDHVGLTNLCWMEVAVEDKIAPICVAPADVTMPCTDLPYGFDPTDEAQLSALFGDATGEDNCGTPTAELVNTDVQSWDCNSGTIVRTFKATDAQGTESINVCEQMIVIEREHEYVIKFPKDPQAAVDCTESMPDTIATWTLGCDLLTVNVKDERFEASGDACYKIKRTYSVINWCEYDGDDDAVQVTRDEDCDDQYGEDDVYVIVRPDGVSYIDADDDETTNPTASPCNGVAGHLTNSGIESRVASTGYWTYVQYIKVVDQTPPVMVAGGDDIFCSVSLDCSSDVVIPLTIVDSCAMDDVTIEVFLLPDGNTGLPAKLDMQTDGAAVGFALGGTYPNYTLSARLPLGNHAFEVQAVDGCQNASLLNIPFEVVDCKAPTPICINGLAIELMPTEEGGGAMMVSVNDFVVSGLEDCSDKVTLSINRVGETPDMTQDALILTCEDLDTVAVEIYAWDDAFNPTAVQPDLVIGGPNYDHCETYVVVQDNMFDLCTDPGVIEMAGLIETQQGNTVELVDVKLTGGMESDMMTTTDGLYHFNELSRGADYTVTPIRDDSHINGVSTFDLVLITKHILGSRRMADPYQLIAADVNRSNNISAFDLIHLRKLILSVYREFPSNTSWRFIPANYEFLDAENPWYEEFPEVLNYNDLQEAIRSGDFVAVKIGDVNGNARANRFMSSVRNLSGVFSIQVADQELKAGNEYKVSFSAAELAQIQGYQFTLNFDRTVLELVDIEYGVAKEENFGLVYAEEGVLTTSWHNLAADVSAVDEPLFTLVFRTRTEGRWSELLSVSSRYTQAEAYNQAEETLDVALDFGTDSFEAAPFELRQNVPNPWQTKTMVSFYLPEADQATLTIHDVQGRVLQVIRGEYAAGENQLELKRSALPTTGVLYYTLETSKHAATRKMIIVE